MTGPGSTLPSTLQGLTVYTYPKCIIIEGKCGLISGARSSYFAPLFMLAFLSSGGVLNTIFKKESLVTFVEDGDRRCWNGTCAEVVACIH